jgi:hypothetical protein
MLINVYDIIELIHIFFKINCVIVLSARWKIAHFECFESFERFLSHVVIYYDHCMWKNNHKLTFIWSSNEKEEKKNTSSLKTSSHLHVNRWLYIENVFNFSYRVRKKHYITLIKRNLEKWVVCWLLFCVNNFSSSRFSHFYFSFRTFFHLFIKFSFFIYHAFHAA